MKKYKKMLFVIFSLLCLALTGCNSSEVVKEYYDMSNIEFVSNSFYYDGNAHSLIISGELPEGVEVTYENNNQVEVGVYEVVAKFEGDEETHYPIEDMKAMLIIYKSEIEGISFNSASFDYDGESHNLEIEGTLPEGVSVSYENNNQVNAGVYEVVAVFTDTTGNYSTLSQMKAFMTINKASFDMSNVSFNDVTYTYDGEEKEIVIEGTLPEGVSVSYENNKLTNAGSTEACAHFVHSNPNYNDIPSMKAKINVVQSSIKDISFNSKTVTYDGNAHSLSIEGTLPEGVSVSYINNSQTNAGVYEVVAVFKDTTGNYSELTPMKAVLTINKQKLEGIYFADETVTYDGKSHSLEIKGLLPEGVSVIYTNNEQVNVGSYVVTANIVDTTGNYEASEKLCAVLNIVKQKYNVTYDGKTVTYDGNAHSLSIEELPSGVYVIYSENSFVNVGNYLVTANIIDTTGNYDIPQVVHATLIIEKYKIQNINFDDKTVTYDANVHSLSIEGTLPEGVSVSYFNNNQVNAGTYEVVAVFEDITGNYEVPNDMYANLVIEKYKITKIKFVDQKASYSGYIYSLAIECFETIPEGVYISYMNNSHKEPGTYEVVAIFTDTTGNYEVPEEMHATLTIVKDGKYHDVIFHFEDENTIKWVVENNKVLTELPSIPYKKGHIGDWSEGTELPITSDVEFRVIYTPNQYTITYNANGGEIEETEQVVTYGDDVELLIPSRKGYTFEYYTFGKQVFDGKYLFDTDIELVAKWTPNQYTITYNANGGILSEYEQTIYYDSIINYLYPINDTLLFEGWFLDGKLFTEKTYTFDHDIILDARYLVIDENINNSYYVLDSLNKEVSTKLYATRNTSGIYFYVEYKTLNDYSYGTNWWEGNNLEFRFVNQNGIISVNNDEQFWISLYSEGSHSKNMTNHLISEPILLDNGYYLIRFKFFISYSILGIEQDDLIGFTFGFNPGGVGWTPSPNFNTSNLAKTLKITENGIFEYYDESITCVDGHEIDDAIPNVITECTNRIKETGICKWCGAEVEIHLTDEEHEEYMMKNPLYHVGEYDNGLRQWTCCGYEVYTKNDRYNQGGWTNTDDWTYIIGNVEGDFTITTTYSYESNINYNDEWWKGVMLVIQENIETSPTEGSTWVSRMDWWGWCDQWSSTEKLTYEWENENMSNTVNVNRDEWWTNESGNNATSDQLTSALTKSTIVLKCIRTGTTVRNEYTIYSQTGEVFTYWTQATDISTDKSLNIALVAEFARYTVTSVSIER